MKPLDYFNPKAAQEAIERRAERGASSGGVGDSLLNVAGELGLRALFECLGSAIEFVLTLLSAGF